MIQAENTQGSRDEGSVAALPQASPGPGVVDDQLVDVAYRATIDAPIETIDIPAWCFNLPEHEYCGCSPAHVAAGFTTSPQGKRMSINVEVIGATILVQHYVEVLGRKHHLILESVTDVFAPAGRSTFVVIWEMSVCDLGGGRCEFTNRVRSRASEDFLALLAKQGIPFEQFRAQRQPASVDHVKNETPLFAASIQRAALRADEPRPTESNGARA
jgi:hypothetical protein